ncbi:MAG: Dehydrogenase [uncultured Corynebacteriales bacterium]|uniref:Dehydrogenase n=1 Tax=uncultured Mycobacteriales bacterium TaxID=581187 RepID=A0A6J4I9A3_9ACTN|nr:MAG: Dehydrogenase [uncultured Corynebacteriales bacterium]
MVKLGYFLSCEEFDAPELVRQARLAEEAGFEALWISDHFHPWLAEQGNSPFVWSVIGALSQVTDLPITTAVTCPTTRVHPAIIAQAAATSAVLTGGRFTLGVGTGEALNEHVLGDPWPSADIRLDMLEEALEVIRALWTGEVVEHHGTFYDVEHARLYSLPETPPDIYVSGFGPKAATLAGRIGDGFVCTKPDPDLIRAFRDGGGTGKPTQVGTKVCWGPDEDEARRTAHHYWRNEGLPGELAQILPTPEHFQQASTLVEPEAMVTPVGPDAKTHVEALRKFVDAGYDELYVQQIGPDQDGFFSFFSTSVLPELRG